MESSNNSSGSMTSNASSIIGNSKRGKLLTNHTSSSPTKNLNLSSLKGHKWKSFCDITTALHEANKSDDDETKKKSRLNSNVMRLDKADMGLFGLCPETDPFYAVVCDICDAVVKPQGLQKHLLNRHNIHSINKERMFGSCSDLNYPSSSTSTTTTGFQSNLPNNYQSSSSSSLLINQSSSNYTSTITSTITSSTSTLMTTMAPPVTSGVPSSLYSTNKNKTKIKTKSSKNYAASTGTGTGTQNSIASDITKYNTTDGMSFGVKKQDNRKLIVDDTNKAAASVVTQSSSTQRRKNQNNKTTTTRKCIPVKDREYMPDVHCGVLTGELLRPCTRSLTCKSHALSLRRLVPGRSQTFDKLLSDHRLSKPIKQQQQQNGYGGGEVVIDSETNSNSSSSSNFIDICRKRNQISNNQQQPISSLLSHINIPPPLIIPPPEILTTVTSNSSISTNNISTIINDVTYDSGGGGDGGGGPPTATDIYDILFNNTTITNNNTPSRDSAARCDPYNSSLIDVQQQQQQQSSYLPLQETNYNSLNNNNNNNNSLELFPILQNTNNDVSVNNNNNIINEQQQQYSVSPPSPSICGQSSDNLFLPYDSDSFIFSPPSIYRYTPNSTILFEQDNKILSNNNNNVVNVIGRCRRANHLSYNLRSKKYSDWIKRLNIMIPPERELREKRQLLSGVYKVNDNGIMHYLFTRNDQLKRINYCEKMIEEVNKSKKMVENKLREIFQKFSKKFPAQILPGSVLRQCSLCHGYKWTTYDDGSTLVDEHFWPISNQLNDDKHGPGCRQCIYDLNSNGCCHAQLGCYDKNYCGSITYHMKQLCYFCNKERYIPYCPKYLTDTEMTTSTTTGAKTKNKIKTTATTTINKPQIQNGCNFMYDYTNTTNILPVLQQQQLMQTSSYQYSTTTNLQYDDVDVTMPLNVVSVLPPAEIMSNETQENFVLKQIPDNSNIHTPQTVKSVILPSLQMPPPLLVVPPLLNVKQQQTLQPPMQANPKFIPLPPLIPQPKFIPLPPLLQQQPKSQISQQQEEQALKHKSQIKNNNEVDLSTQQNEKFSTQKSTTQKTQIQSNENNEMDVQIESNKTEKSQINSKSASQLTQPQLKLSFNRDVPQQFSTIHNDIMQGRPNKTTEQTIKQKQPSSSTSKENSLTIEQLNSKEQQHESNDGSTELFPIPPNNGTSFMVPHNFDPSKETSPSKVNVKSHKYYNNYSDHHLNNEEEERIRTDAALKDYLLKKQSELLPENEPEASTTNKPQTITDISGNSSSTNTVNTTSASAPSESPIPTELAIQKLSAKTNTRRQNESTTIQRQESISKQQQSPPVEKESPSSGGQEPPYKQDLTSKQESQSSRVRPPGRQEPPYRQHSSVTKQEQTRSKQQQQNTRNPNRISSLRQQSRQKRQANNTTAQSSQANDSNKSPVTTDLTTIEPETIDITEDMTETEIVHRRSAPGPLCSKTRTKKEIMLKRSVTSKLRCLLKNMVPPNSGYFKVPAIPELAPSPPPDIPIIDITDDTDQMEIIDGDMNVTVPPPGSIKKEYQIEEPVRELTLAEEREIQLAIQEKISTRQKIVKNTVRLLNHLKNKRIQNFQSRQRIYRDNRVDELNGIGEFIISLTLCRGRNYADFDTSFLNIIAQVFVEQYPGNRITSVEVFINRSCDISLRVAGVRYTTDTFDELPLNYMKEVMNVTRPLSIITNLNLTIARLHSGALLEPPPGWDANALNELSGLFLNTEGIDERKLVETRDTERKRAKETGEASVNKARIVGIEKSDFKLDSDSPSPAFLAASALDTFRQATMEVMESKPKTNKKIQIVIDKPFKDFTDDELEQLAEDYPQVGNYLQYKPTIHNDHTKPYPTPFILKADYEAQMAAEAAAIEAAKKYPKPIKEEPDPVSGIDKKPDLDQIKVEIKTEIKTEIKDEIKDESQQGNNDGDDGDNNNNDNNNVAEDDDDDDDGGGHIYDNNNEEEDNNEQYNDIEDDNIYDNCDIDNDNDNSISEFEDRIDCQNFLQLSLHTLPSPLTFSPKDDLSDAEISLPNEILSLSVPSPINDDEQQEQQQTEEIHQFHEITTNKEVEEELIQQNEQFVMQQQQQEQEDEEQLFNVHPHDLEQILTIQQHQEETQQYIEQEQIQFVPQQEQQQQELDQNQYLVQQQNLFITMQQQQQLQQEQFVPLQEELNQFLTIQQEQFIPQHLHHHNGQFIIQQSELLCDDQQDQLSLENHGDEFNDIVNIQMELQTNLEDLTPTALFDEYIDPKDVGINVLQDINITPIITTPPPPLQQITELQPIITTTIPKEIQSKIISTTTTKRRRISKRGICILNDRAINGNLSIDSLNYDDVRDTLYKRLKYGVPKMNKKKINHSKSYLKININSDNDADDDDTDIDEPTTTPTPPTMFIDHLYDIPTLKSPKDSLSLFDNDIESGNNNNTSSSGSFYSIKTNRRKEFPGIKKWYRSVPKPCCINTFPLKRVGGGMITKKKMLSFRKSILTNKSPHSRFNSSLSYYFNIPHAQSIDTNIYHDSSGTAYRIVTTNTGPNRTIRRIVVPVNPTTGMQTQSKTWNLTSANTIAAAIQSGSSGNTTITSATVGALTGQIINGSRATTSLSTQQQFQQTAAVQQIIATTKILPKISTLVTTTTTGSGIVGSNSSGGSSGMTLSSIGSGITQLQSGGVGPTIISGNNIYRIEQRGNSTTTTTTTAVGTVNTIGNGNNNNSVSINYPCKRTHSSNITNSSSSNTTSSNNNNNKKQQNNDDGFMKRPKLDIQTSTVTTPSSTSTTTTFK